MLCIEGNAIEQQALLLCESIRHFCGQYAKSPILAVSPRPELPISARSSARLAEMNVQHVSLPLNRTGSTISINRIVAGAWAEENVSTDYIVVLDLDTVFVGEPALLCCDAGARPVDVKGNTSVGPSDPLDAYWRTICDTQASKSMSSRGLKRPSTGFAFAPASTPALLWSDALAAFCTRRRRFFLLRCGPICGRCGTRRPWSSRRPDMSELTPRNGGDRARPPLARQSPRARTN